MHLAETLMALGGAFLAAGLAARLGRRVGLPTIPLFMLAGLLLGPNTPGLALVQDPTEFALLSSFGLILLLFYLGLEFHLGDLVGVAAAWSWPGPSTCSSTWGWVSDSVSPSTGGAVKH